jgi:hypothetical protein
MQSYITYMYKIYKSPSFIKIPWMHSIGGTKGIPPPPPWNISVPPHLTSLISTLCPRAITHVHLLGPRPARGSPFWHLKLLMFWTFYGDRTHCALRTPSQIFFWGYCVHEKCNKNGSLPPPPTIMPPTTQFFWGGFSRPLISTLCTCMVLYACALIRGSK